MLSNKFLTLSARIVLSIVFILASVEKISDPQLFAVAIYNYKLIPDFLVNFFAIVLPWIELTAAILLIFGIAVKENATILISLLTIFIFMIAVSMMRGLNIECGCFGTTSGAKVGWLKIIENLGLVLLGLWVLVFDEGQITLGARDQSTEK